MATLLLLTLMPEQLIALALSKRGKLKQQQQLLVLLNFWTGNGEATSVRFHTHGDHRKGGFHQGEDQPVVAPVARTCGRKREFIVAQLECPSSGTRLVHFSWLHLLHTPRNTPKTHRKSTNFGSCWLRGLSISQLKFSICISIIALLGPSSIQNCQSSGN